MEKVALITGATSGVGRVVAERLGALGWRVLVDGRDRARGAEVVRAIEAAGEQAKFLQADLASLAGVRALAGAVASEAPRLPLLINNAGVGFGAKSAPREESADGFELRFAVNYLAPFLLTRLLLPNVRAAAPARIVNVASIGQGDLDFGDLQVTRGYSGVEAYRRSKLALIMMSFDLAEELKASDVAVNAVHPATFMDTAMVREMGVTPMSTPEEGADAIMRLAVSETRTGLYFDGLKEARARDQAYDSAARALLRRLSFDLTGAPA
jgi:NAD(P)-dependent dehydrogenase (short-subunit alcohol dehydrogenase family)